MTLSRPVIVATLVAWSSLAPLTQGPRLVPSLSGPSGKVVGRDFVLDEVRSRFVYPQDRSATIYFRVGVPSGRPHAHRHMETARRWGRLRVA